MAPRAKWEKLIPTFNYEIWSLTASRHDLAKEHFPVMASFYENGSNQYGPMDVINELVSLRLKKADGLMLDKFTALQKHVVLADPANCLRLANELLMIKSAEEPIAVFMAEFLRDLLAKRG